MTRARKIWLFVAGLFLLVVGSTSWLVGTDNGTRWILGKVAAGLPEQIAIGEARGSLLHGVRISSFEWRGESARILAREIDLDIRLIPLFFRQIAVNELSVSQFDIEIIETAPSSDPAGLPTIAVPIGISIANAHLRNLSYRDGAIAQTADDIRLAVSLSGSDLDITRLELRSTSLDLDVDGRVRLSGSWPGRANIVWRWHQADSMQFTGNLQLQGDTRRYELQHALTAPVAVSTSGSISYEGRNLLADLTNRWDSLEFPIGDRRLRTSAATLRLQGSVESFAVDLDTVAQLDDLPETRIELTGDADPESIQVSRVRAVNSIGELGGSGHARWLPEQSFELDFSLSDLDPSTVSDDITGTLAVDGRIDGVFREQGPEIGLRIDQLSGDVNGYSLQGGANIAYAADLLSIADGRMQIGANRVTVNGSVGNTVSLDANFDFGAITELLPAASGSLHGRLGLSGSRDSPDAAVEVTGSALHWDTYSIGDLAADANISRTDRSFVELNVQRLSAGQFSLESARASASGRLDNHDIRVLLHGYDSELRVVAGGNLSGSLWSGRVNSLEIANEALGSWSSNRASDLIVSGEELALSETCVVAPSEQGQACFGGNFQKAGGASLDFALSDLPLSAIPLALPGAVNLGGFMDARLHLEEQENRLTGNAGVELRQAMVDATYDGETISVGFSDASAEATIKDNRIDSTLRLEMAEGAGEGGLQLTVLDFTDSQSSIAGQGDVSINDVSLFAVFLPGISNPRGKIDGGLTISGNLGQPEFVGEVALIEGAFAVRQAGVEIVDIDARLSQRGPGRLQLAGSARSGSGQVSIRGDTSVGTDSGIRTEIIISGENFELARTPEWQLAASPSILVVFDERATLVSGDLEIPTANITVNEVPVTAESPSPDAIVHRAEGTESFSGRRLAIDVRTTLGSDVQFSGFGLTAGLEGAVRLQGGTDAPYVGNGTLVLRDGRYRAYRQELEIERGELRFNGPLTNPQLDIRAIRRTNDVVAGIQLSGTPTQLRSRVFSEPAMSDAEALSYLLTGRPVSSATNPGEGDVLNNAAFALGMSGAGTIASQVRSELGLEVLTVESSSDSGRIVAGKRFGNRLLVEYGYGVIDKLGTLLLRYQLSDRIVLESRTGTVSNLDIVYSVKKQ